jgi:helicase SWR1
MAIDTAADAPVADASADASVPPITEDDHGDAMDTDTSEAPDETDAAGDSTKNMLEVAPSVTTAANTPVDHPTPAAPSENAPSTTTTVSAAAAPSSESPPPSDPKTPIPSLLRGTLREYQHYGLDWLAGLYANRTNGILADEMGLGKTIQTIALLAHLACHHEVWGPHLVIVPTSVMLNWEMEFKKWCPGFKILAYYGSQEERKRPSGVSAAALALHDS